MIARAALLGATALVASAAQAADKPLYQPAPAWVVPAPPIDPASLTADGPVYVLVDDQERLADGTVWSYHDVASRMATPEVVQQSGTISLTWQPAKGDLVVHRVEIVRNGQHIDVLAGGRNFTVIRREQQLERFSLDGELTATMAVEGLQVGDLLRVTATTSRREDALGGGVQDVAFVPTNPLRAGFVRTRLLWPATTKLQTKVLAEGVQGKLASLGPDRELTITGVAPKPAELPDDAPIRYRPLPLVEASSFADWASVSRVMAPLYATDGVVKPGSDLERQVAAVKAAGDPLHRIDAALELVQGKVRYLFNGLDKGNYVPQPAEQTWTARYGDCKAKTLLLLALLHGAGIEAEPVLANAEMGDLVPKRLPSAAAFNHVLVRATVDGHDYWLDGTSSGARFADLGDTPPFRWVLPLRPGGSGLVEVPTRAPATPGAKIVLELDQSAGIRLPTLVHATLTMRGPAAGMVGLAKTQGSKEQKDQLVQGVLSKMVGGGDVALSGFTLAFDPAEAVATIDAHGITSSLWDQSDNRYRLLLDKAVSGLSFDPDRARPAWQAIPVATGAPETIAYTTKVRLPADLSGFTLDGDATLTETLGTMAIHRTAALADGVVTVEERTASSGGEIAPGDLQAVRARVALARQRLLRLVAPADLPTRWAVAAKARADGRFKPILATYAAEIADDPKSATGYVNRANFLLGVFDWKGALPDLDRALALEPTADLYLRRADAYRVIGDQAKALADAESARGLDPTSLGALSMIGEHEVDAGQRDKAIAMVQERIDAGGEQKTELLALKADLLARAGDAPGALAAMDQAIAIKPGSPSLLNGRCWDKALLNTALDTALKDCTKSIELSDSALAALDSRALVYFRLNRLDDAMADVTAVLDQDPNVASTLFLRGLIRQKRGDKAGAAADLAGAQAMAPLLPAERKRFGIVPAGS